MEAIIKFFQGVGDLLLGIVDFIVGFFEDVVYMIQLTGKVVVSIPSYFSWMPGEIVTLIVIIFGVVVLYKVLGREG